MKYIFITSFGKEGYGHLFRCQAIYQALVEIGVECRFIINADLDNLVHIEKKNYICFNWYKNKKKLLKIVAEEKNVILDSLLIKKQLFNDIKSSCKNFIYIDDFNRWKHDKGIIIDWTVGLKNKKKSKNVNYLFGEKYTSLRKAFWGIEPRITNREIKRILVSFSSDNNNLLPNVIREITKQFNKVKIDILIPKKTNFSIRASKKYLNFHIKLTDKQIMKLMLKSDIAIAAGGQTLYELAATGTPCIAIISNDNQFEDTLGFEKIGFLKNCGFYKTDDYISKLSRFLVLLESFELRLVMSKIGQKTIDGNGAIRVAEFIKENTK